MNTLQICPPHLLDVATSPWEIEKNRFATLLFEYFRLFTLPEKKTKLITYIHIHTYFISATQSTHIK